MSEQGSRSTRVMVILLIVLLIGALSGSIGLLTWHNKNRAYFVGGIVIYRDEDFTDYYNFPGNGTKENPYRIENLVITPKSLYGIKISRTSSHFIIRNCQITAEYPIVLVNTSHGTVRIENNSIYGNYHPGIELIYCPGSIVSNNTIVGSATYCYGIATTGCYDSIISHNVCNNLKYGLYLRGLSDYLIVRSNTCNNNMYGIFFMHEDTYLLDGRLIRSHSIIIANNTCSDNSERGMFVSWAENAVISGNNCSRNNRSGYGGGGQNSTFMNNYFGFNGIGLNIEYFSNSTIKGNNFSNNTGVAINADGCTNIVIYQNNFFNNYYSGIQQNRSQVNDDSSPTSEYGPNIWYNVTLSQGNFWSELIWFPGVVYEIDGGNNEDLYPVENPIDL
ncbi:MAG: hypothetical protein HGN29_17720 [Asgard group archaeon]|nr:hypothetical protein [Asgard group archaeon]